MILHSTGPPPRRRPLSRNRSHPRHVWPDQPEQSAAHFEARNPGSFCVWVPHEGVFRVWVHRDHLIHGPVVAPDLNYLEAALRGRVPDVHLNVATPPEQADTQLTAKLTVYIRAYLTQRSKHAD